MIKIHGPAIIKIEDIYRNINEVEVSAGSICFVPADKKIINIKYL